MGCVLVQTRQRINCAPQRLKLRGKAGRLLAVFHFTVHIDGFLKKYANVAEMSGINVTNTIRKCVCCLSSNVDDFAMPCFKNLPKILIIKNGIPCTL
jgi:hypothetical protein